jgi:histone deacetylase 1/2
MKSEADPSVYVTQVGDVKFFIVVYVDDLILVCNDQNKLLRIKEELNQKFEMKDLGELHFFLGMEVERNHDQRLLRINQIKYLKEILKCFRMEECKPIGVSFNPKMKLQRNANGNDEWKGFPYQQVVGSLMYAMLRTRLDLAYPINVLSQYMANPSMEHWMAVKRIFRYLQSTL